MISEKKTSFVFISPDVYTDRKERYQQYPHKMFKLNFNSALYARFNKEMSKTGSFSDIETCSSSLILILITNNMYITTKSFMPLNIFLDLNINLNVNTEPTQK